MFYIENQSINTSVCYYLNEKGRSMIEMLGVLAIVGILSVGAISAYQKAMVKHEANKFIEGIAQVVQNFTLYSKDWKKLAKNEDTLVSVGQYMKNAGFVPKSLSKETMYFGAYPNRIFFNFNVKPKAGYQEKCQMLFTQVFIPYGDTILYIHRYGRDEGGNSINDKFYKGRAECRSTEKCIPDFKFEDIINVCQYYEDEVTVFFSAYFK
ncbi:MAG: hypothetical protein J6A09_02360 [Alphaproteobacteria bacterium]|nr:hypothetical protein [Alphaproteobacteria bacterium]